MTNHFYKFKIHVPFALNELRKEKNNITKVSIFTPQTLPALSKMNKTLSSASEMNYHTWFYDLHGGRTEYVITIACMIGKKRLYFLSWDSNPLSLQVGY